MPRANIFRFRKGPPGNIQRDLRQGRKEGREVIRRGGSGAVAIGAGEEEEINSKIVVVEDLPFFLGRGNIENNDRIN